VRIDGGDVLKEGTVFHWSTFGLLLESKVNEFVPYTRIGSYETDVSWARLFRGNGLPFSRLRPALLLTAA
jgi:hypothetical protein